MNRKGFTLLELLIVILIIAIIATLAVPQYINFIERSRAAEAIRILGMIRLDQTRYYIENGNFASSLSDLDGNYPSGGYWVYEMTHSPTIVVITAQRTAEDAAPEYVGKTIQVHLLSTGSWHWSGDHVGMPREKSST